jgi:hypothetical protein
MTDAENSNTHPACKSWRNSSGLALILTILSFIIFIVIGCITTGDFEIKPTQIVLKTDECSFLRQYGISSTNATAGTGSCSVLVPYRVNSIGAGGVIVIENGPQIKIPENQVMIVGSIENQPWSSSQTRTAFLLGTSSLFMLLMLIWFFMITISFKS